VRRAASSPALDVPDEDASTNVNTPPPGRPSLKRRITRPTFMTELTEGSVVGEYEVQAQIGEGAMGTVYSGIHPLIGKKVAIKVLKPELCANQVSIDRFVHEAQAVNKIGHPNIVDVFSLGELEDGRAYFVMEWLRGEDLKTRLARGPITVSDACDILDGIARALDAAHAKDIVHRDLKPDNVFLHQVDNGPLMVKLLDFGIAKLVRTTPGTEKTQTGNMLGTPRYISPEQARGIHVDHRSDIYSLGVMAYEMLAGRPPFQGETAMDLVVKHMNEEPPPLSQFAKVPKPLEQSVMAMLAKDPDKRPGLEDVRSILVDPSRRLTPVSTRAYELATPVSIPVTNSRRRWPIAVAAIIGAAGLGVLTWKLVGGSHETATTASQGPVSASQEPSVAVTPTPPPLSGDPAPAGSAGSAGSGQVAPAAAARGTLEVEVTGAKDSVIFVDKEEWGRGASIKIELDPGVHEIVVKPPGRTPITQKITMVAGQVNHTTVVVPREKIVVRPSRTPKTAPKETKKPPGDDELLKPKRNR
jgi:serine/threonine-protein kinase